MSMERLEQVTMRRIEARTDAAGAHAVRARPGSTDRARRPPASEPQRAVAAPARIAVSPLQLASQATGAQHTLVFLQRAHALLAAVRDALGERGATQSDASEAIAQHVARFERHWQGRHAATGGRLCERLVYGEADSARRIFRIRGLDTAAAAGGRSEVLAFHTGLRMAPCVVRLDSRMPAPAQARRLSEALAPIGVMAFSDAHAGIAFSVVESRWPALARELAISGEGIRFSGGRANPVHAEPDAGAIVPRDWRWDEPGATRESLARVGTALDAVRQLQYMLRGVLDHARQTVAHAIDTAEWQPPAPDALVPMMRRASLTTRIDARHVSALLRLPGPPR